MLETGEYRFKEHRHRYACWTAARAVQRSFVKTPLIFSAIDRTTLRGFTEKRPANTQADFDLLHATWCRNLINIFNEMGVFCSFGGDSVQRGHLILLDVDHCVSL